MTAAAALFAISPLHYSIQPVVGVDTCVGLHAQVQHQGRTSQRQEAWHLQEQDLMAKQQTISLSTRQKEV